MRTELNSIENALITEAAAADYLGISIRTIQAWRMRGGGPIFVKLGKSVRYRPSDIQAWIEAHLASSTSEVEARS
ncbi:DNA binding domain-containing protein, excisionase family [Pseudovibrio ascidiaceicola]|uniref:DNA binding domain-containing protein, excisionase family n=1 Tax=Pseudovibrio ascidiaceicola TaxID=285279 RepID=A0A1I4G167_9HYPH|nr:helix-turn-helix domain-containing protein [Pseudovibrio ascidiaceicola]SFL23902.1 DNA binding domain-containing protein, excisionase family [Pseudovibrio ascidiaceicola]